jgi:hypothetical protein
VKGEFSNVLPDAKPMSMPPFVFRFSVAEVTEKKWTCSSIPVPSHATSLALSARPFLARSSWNLGSFMQAAMTFWAR